MKCSQHKLLPLGSSPGTKKPRPLAWLMVTFATLLFHMPPASAIERTVPIPPKRPDVLSASPNYIRQLLSRYQDNTKISAGEKRGYQSPTKKIPKSDQEPTSKTNTQSPHIEDFSNNPVSVRMSTIAPEAGEYRNKLPHAKNNAHADPAYFDDEETTVRQPILVPEKTEDEEALVSFMLAPDQVILDPGLKEFLRENAVKMFKDNPALRLEIHAYASTINGQAHSDIRRSLARALEVRSFLLEQNIHPSRLKLTPFGQDPEDTTNDRIDLIFIASGK